MVREGARFKIVEEDASAASLELTQMSDEGRLLLQSGCATLPNSKEKAPPSRQGHTVYRKRVEVHVKVTQSDLGPFRGPLALSLIIHSCFRA